MIPCTDFIPAYSELFKYLEEKGGKEAVYGFWNYISDNYLGNFKQIVEEKGLRGCWEYWSRALNEEAADFTMVFDEDAEEFRITMHNCPSKGLLMKLKHMEPYHDYCAHCGTLYSRILEPAGFSFEVDFSQIDKARCATVIRPDKSKIKK